MHLQSLFSPASIAIIGASTRPGSVGHSLTKNILTNGYSGNVFLINPKTDTLFDLPCYKNISDITTDVDLAIIIIPALLVPEALRQAGEKGVKAAVIISSGFKETGAEGKALEDQIFSIAKEFNMALLGPNCLGFLHPSIGLNASFANRMPKKGDIAFFSQSGALCTAILDLTAGELGFSYFVSTGNKARVSENDLLKFFAQDNETHVLSMYTEDIKNSKEIIETGRAILARSEPKPIIALKSGTTTAGTSASSSHTGALAGSDSAYQALFTQARIVRAESLEHLLDLVSVFSTNPLPNGNRVGIVTNAGGMGVLATDAAVLHGLEMATLSPETVQKLTALPAAASKHNPVDVLGDALADRYTLAIQAVANDPEVDMLLVILTPQAMTEAEETCAAIVALKTETSKPIVVVLSGKDSFKEGKMLLQKNSVAAYLYPESAARALSALAELSKWQKNQLSTKFTFDDIDRDSARTLLEKVHSESRTQLYETEVWELLKAYGFPLLKSAVAKSKDEAIEAAKTFSGPIAMKIISPEITHKSDVGGVLLGVTQDEAGEAYEKLIERVKKNVPEAHLEGALLVEMAETGGKEIILGVKTEPGLGKLIMVGLGGIFVETFKDVSFRFSPLTEEDAMEMLQELKSLPLLTGARGQAGIDKSTLVSYIGRLSILLEDFPEIEELDINPLLAFSEPDKFRVLDGRIRLQ